MEDFFHYGKRRTERSLTWHCPHPTSSSKFLCKLSVPIVGCKKWRHSQLYLEKFKISTLINKCPGFPGNSWQKELAKKKRVQIQTKNTNLQFTPPIATNMEVNLRIVTLVNVEVFFLHYGKRRTERSLTWHCPHPTSSSKFLCKLSVPIVGCKKMEAFPALS